MPCLCPTGVTTLLGPTFVRDLTSGRVNGVDLTSDLLTTDTEQTVTSHLRLDSLQVTLNVVTDRVNGLDLSREVVRTTGHPGTVNGERCRREGERGRERGREREGESERKREIDSGMNDRLAGCFLILYHMMDILMMC